MGIPKNTIKVNGRLYDTATGKAVTQAHIITPSSAQTAPKPAHKDTDTAATRIPVRVTSSASQPTVQRAAGTTAHAVHHTAEHTKTLMRHAVKKPAGHKKITVSGLAPQPKKESLQSAGTKHREPSTEILRSKRITRFAAPSHTLKQRVENIPVKIAPTREHKTEDLPVNYSFKQAPPVMLKHHSNPKTQTSTQLFETALRSANHHQPSHIGVKKHPRRLGKVARIGSSLAIALLLGGFFAYHNMTGIALRSASAKAGFAASLPQYKPVGFSLSNGVKTEGAKIILRYESNTQGNDFELTQQQTQENNTTLTASQLRDKNYLTASRNGVQVFIYGGSNAMWVQNGIWYTITGNAQLSTDQLVRIASSI